MSLRDGGDSRPSRLHRQDTCGYADIIKAGRNESHDRNEPGGSAGGTLGHTEPFIESVGRAEGSQGDSIRVDC